MSEKFIPLEKRSKKEQKEYHKKSRRDWGILSPITRKTKNKKAYDRNREKREREQFTRITCKHFRTNRYIKNLTKFEKCVIIYMMKK